MLEKLLYRRRPSRVSIEDMSRGPCWRIVSVQPARLRLDRSAPSASKPRQLSRGDRGIYAWYADTEARGVLGRAGLEVRPDGLVYIGMTRTTGRTFRKRLRQHVRGASGGDLRKKLNWILYGSPALAGADIDEFMRDHFRAFTIPMRVRPRPGEESISDAERRLIRDAQPCLNRKGLPADTPNVRLLHQLHAEADGAGAGTAEEPRGGWGLFRRAMLAAQRLFSSTTIGPGDRAERPENDGERQESSPSRPLSALGQFRRDFWAHCSRRHPGIAPTGWADSNVRHPAETTGRRFSLCVAQEGVGVFFPRQRGETFTKRAAAVRPTVDWLRAKTGDAELPDNGWSSLELDSRAKRNWDHMADWLDDRRLLYERALRETGR